MLNLLIKRFTVNKRITIIMYYLRVLKVDYTLQLLFSELLFKE